MNHNNKNRSVGSNNPRKELFEERINAFKESYILVETIRKEKLESSHIFENRSDKQYKCGWYSNYIEKYLRFNGLKNFSVSYTYYENMSNENNCRVEVKHDKLWAGDIRDENSHEYNKERYDRKMNSYNIANDYLEEYLYSRDIEGSNRVIPQIKVDNKNQCDEYAEWLRGNLIELGIFDGVVTSRFNSSLFSNSKYCNLFVKNEKK